MIDEAHRLRNVYKPTNIIANTLKQALKNVPTLLLTATPLQNSLLELFGLVSFIDEHAFGDLKSFREQFLNLSQEEVFKTLKGRLKPICHRTLRRQVTAYVPFTKRHAILEEFTPEEGEDRLYELVSEYLRRENLQALPAGQRSLMTLVLRKLLASSSFAIAGALNSISKRLKAKIKKQEPAESLEAELDKDYEALEETAEEWSEDEPSEPISEADRAAIEAEVADLDEFARLATSIEQNAKGKALVKALAIAFKKAVELGSAEKAIIFTESRKTQSYLLRVLADSPFKHGIVLFNGSNTDDRSRAIYAAWLEKHAGTDRVSGSKTADMRSALVDYFREEGRIMIATEAGAEGINLQFCSLVVNYDLPWNPQRIEQRIGRCHRYGQKHDVVVVNFLNRKNAADQRVYELLSEKFQLFEGVFGASDEVLGAIESGVDFEKRINDIYQRCRKHEEIKVAFDKLQLELDFEINEAMTQTRRKLLENFDDEVREKLKVSNEKSRAYLNRFEQVLMELTRHELKSYHAAHRVTEHDRFDNRLIFGDNLLALKALEQEFSGQIKCIYIDPPYNTGSAFEHYDDGVEHSIWLSMMRDRMDLIRRLLSEDGSVWISLDDNENHYFKVMMDEVFGRQNFVATIIWQKVFTVKNSARHFSDMHDYVVVYAKDATKWQRNLLPRSEELDSTYLNPDNDPRGPWTTNAVQARNYYSLGEYEIRSPAGKSFFPPKGTYWRISKATFDELNRDGRVWWGRDRTNIPRIKKFLSEAKQGVVPATLWFHDDCGTNAEAKTEVRSLFSDEADAEMFITPKPERLLKRTLEIATNPGDWVLDSFAGSGTTGAVAHKMGRRWILVELGEHCHTHIIPRLKKVVAGADPGGITEAVGWKGGGGFRYYRLAPSLLEKDKWGNWVISKEYNAAMLAEALCKLEGFTYAPSDTVYWQHGHSTERDFLYVTTANLNHEQLQALGDEVGAERSLLVVCCAFRGRKEGYPNLTVKKIPKAILARCEWGHDDYSLQVENLPKAPPKPGQQEMALV